MLTSQPSSGFGLKALVSRGSPRKALIGSAVFAACVSVLSAGQAQALGTDCSSLAPLIGAGMKISNISCTGDIAGSSDVLIFFNELGTLEYNFLGFTSPIGGSEMGSIKYDIETTLPDFSFRTVQLTADGSTGSFYDATKKIDWGLDSFTLAVDQTGAEPVFAFPPLTAFKTLTITDSWKADLGVLTAVTNNFTQGPDVAPPESVPGPLPILGAGAAFGYSRKLRSRLKLNGSKSSS
ncbi:hypothetical protein [Cyanobium gracile]|uniref:PEP-CTERM sorting domain-containing protein n=1 Tax=Cyanobium gracile UHCC 0281 TaxID=3110309 RepID=A0ABU5SYZ0_9CYAN|nr:hypothetical protein [Cyanobium gracile]MEA5443247.1 hypothetical protein [Cyanobium gracile UHCC 0281]